MYEVGKMEMRVKENGGKKESLKGKTEKTLDVTQMTYGVVCAADNPKLSIQIY